jgi:hypothetical protein
VLLVRTAAPLGADPAALARSRGATVTGRGLAVTAVAADEGFWIRDAAGGRFWVQLVGVRGGESRPTVRAGDRVELTGTVTPHGTGFAAAAGVRPGEDAALLTRQGAHLAVDQRRLTVHH